MDVRLVTDNEVEERGIDELQKLIKGEDGFVWVDIPDGDGGAGPVSGCVSVRQDPQHPAGAACFVPAQAEFRSELGTMTIIGL